MSMPWCITRGDDFSALHGVDHAPVVALEQRLAARAQLILAASPEIAARFPPAKTMVVSHGVDIDMFSGAFEKAE